MSIKIHNEDYNKFINRKPITSDLSKVNKFIKGKRVMVTGGCGSIGSELIRQLLTFSPSAITIYDNAETPMFYLEQEISKLNSYIPIKYVIGDVRDKDRIIDVFESYKPNIVFHAAAYKHVPVMESNPIEAIKTNVLGTKNVGDVSWFYNIDLFVLISTDKAVNPTNIMGATKRIAEIYVQDLNYISRNTKFIITRFGNVLGSRGSVIPTFLEQIENGGPVRVTHKDIERYFMTIPEACQLVLQASSLGDGGEIFLFNMGEPIKIIDLAKDLIEHFGDDSIKIEIIGLRPGEKLYEELLYNNESMTTIDKNIMKLNDYESDFSSAIPHIKKLCSLKRNDLYKIISLIKTIIPEYERKTND